MRWPGTRARRRRSQRRGEGRRRGPPGGGGVGQHPRLRRRRAARGTGADRRDRAEARRAIAEVSARAQERRRCGRNHRPTFRLMARARARYAATPSAITPAVCEPAMREPPGREAVTAYIHHDDRGERGQQHQGGDPSPSADPDQTGVHRLTRRRPPPGCRHPPLRLRPPGSPAAPTGRASRRMQVPQTSQLERQDQEPA